MQLLHVVLLLHKYAYNLLTSQLYASHTAMSYLYDYYRTSLKAAVILLPLLGMTWVFGLLAINDDTIAFTWIFTILNSLQVRTQLISNHQLTATSLILQGFFIFLFYVVKNKKVNKFFSYSHVVTQLHLNKMHIDLITKSLNSKMLIINTY